jgi:PPP family 3-phenylpropionic acid transporter
MLQRLSQIRVSALAWRLAFLYAALFFVLGCYLPYMPVWLKWRGLGDDQIALLLATPLFLRVLFTPAIAFAADWSCSHRGVLIALGWGSLLAFLLLWAAGGFGMMLLAMVLVGIAWPTLMPMIETVGVSGMRNSGMDYGRVRLWGSGSFILASFGCGVAIGAIGPHSVMPILVASTVLTILGVYLLPRQAAGGEGTPAPRSLKFGDAAKLLHSPSFLLFLCAATTIQASHALFYAFGTIHWREQGIADGTIGALWSFGVLVEICLFAVSARLFASLGATKLMLVAAVAAVLRWSLMAIDPPHWATFLLQGLHGLSFGAAHLAAMYFLSRAVPEDRSATAQGVYSAIVAGLGTWLLTLACGPLYRSLAGEAYAVMAVIALLGVLAAALLMRRWDGERLVGPIRVQPQSADVPGTIVPEL